MPSTSGDPLPVRRTASWSRLAAVALILGGVVAVAGALVFTGGGPGRDVTMRAAQAAASAAGQKADGDAGAEDDGVVTSLDELHAEYGEPPDATWGRLRIPSIGIDAGISYRWVDADGQMPDPSGPGDVAWYDFAGWNGYGGYPGAGNNAVFAGHVDRNGPVDYAGVHYSGPGVFSGLWQLPPGSEIYVEVEGGSSLLYTVAWVKDVGLGDDWKSVVSSETGGVDSITLITCSGDFDAENHAYSHRTIVRAVLS